MEHERETAHAKTSIARWHSKMLDLILNSPILYKFESICGRNASSDHEISGLMQWWKG